MRHGKKRLQLNRFTSWHKATLKSLARNLLINQSIKTTRARAFAVRPLVEKLISLSKENTLAAKRRAYQILCDHKLVSRLFNEIGLRFKHRTGGYVRIINLEKRRGDDANMVIFELTEIIKREIKKPKKTEEAKAKQIEEAKVIEIAPKTEDGAKKEKEKLPAPKKPSKKFLGGIRNIFRKERDSL